MRPEWGPWLDDICPGIRPLPEAVEPIPPTRPTIVSGSEPSLPDSQVNPLPPVASAVPPRPIFHPDNTPAPVGDAFFDRATPQGPPSLDPIIGSVARSATSIPPSAVQTIHNEHSGVSVINDNEYEGIADGREDVDEGASNEGDEAGDAVDGETPPSLLPSEMSLADWLTLTNDEVQLAAWVTSQRVQEKPRVSVAALLHSLLPC